MMQNVVIVQQAIANKTALPAANEGGAVQRPLSHAGQFALRNA